MKHPSGIRLADSRKEHAFSLVEMLIVLAVVAIQPGNIPLTDEGITDMHFQLPGAGPYAIGCVGRFHISPKGTYPVFDGPQKVEMNSYASAALGNVVWNHSALEDAYNPPQAVTKYRVVYFKYLDE